MMFSLFSSNKKNSHRYSPLRPESERDGEFRLLVLRLGRRGSQIHCELIHASVHSPPAYEALSYTWGDPMGVRSRMRQTDWRPGQCRTIFIGEHQIDVTYNLDAALQRIRSETRQKVLWVDAICIDQSNPDEKGKQVQLMAMIYRQAHRVLCWLGEADCYTDLAFDTLHELSWAFKARIWQGCSAKLDVSISELSESAVESVIESEAEALPAQLSPSASDGLFGILTFPRIRHEFLESLKLIPMDSSPYASLSDTAMFIFGHSRSLAKFLVSDTVLEAEPPLSVDICVALRETFWYRSYWERLWVVQEIQNAKEAVILCGNRWTDSRVMVILEVLFLSTLPSHSGDNYITSTMDTKKLLNQAASEVIRPINLFTGFTERIRTGARPSLVMNLSFEKSGTTSEPHDAIYALLNVSKSNGILPDYNIPVPELYIKTTRSIIRQNDNLNVLCFTVRAGLTRKHGLTLKFKLPSWVPHYNTMLEYQNFNINTVDHRGYECRTNTECNLSVSDVRVLRLSGIFYTTITRVAKKLNQKLSDDEWVDVLSVKESASIDLNFWRVFFRDKCIIGPTHSPYRAHIIYSNEPFKNLKSDLQSVWTTWQVPARLKYALTHFENDKSICVTSSNEQVIVYGDAEVGDQIFYARGAPCPFVVRQTVADESYLDTQIEQSISEFYQLVGPTYMHGIMGGKLFDMSPPEMIEQESIYLI